VSKEKMLCYFFVSRQKSNKKSQERNAQYIVSSYALIKLLRYCNFNNRIFISSAY